LCLSVKVQCHIINPYHSSTISGQASEPCELRVLSSGVFVPFGEWVQLNCTFNCPNLTHWESRLQKKNLQSGLNWISVEVLVNDWEKSELFCFQDLGNGSTRQSMSVVMAYAVPRHVIIDLDQKMEEGKDHRIICMVYDVAPVKNLQIQLLRDNMVIHNLTFKEDGRKGKQMVNATYEVTASRMDNHRNFSCRAILEVAAGEFITVNSSSLIVRTYGQPDVPVLAITPESNIREGDTFTINCLSDGSPSPEYHWMVPTGANVTYARNKSMVLVSKAGKIHNGVYTCEVRNEYGQVRGSQSVQVTPPTRGKP
ncbi:hypothetical protein PRIEUP_LOCUS1016, partial [Pristimantis euphronides]